jgi:hypothetical protein
VESGQKAWHAGLVIIFEAAAVFIGALTFLSLVSPGIAYQWALFTGIAYGADAGDLYSRMPTVLDRRWAILASATAALCSLAFVSQTLWSLIAALVGVAAVIGYASVRGYGFVRAAARELGLPRSSGRA